MVQKPGSTTLHVPPEHEFVAAAAELPEVVSPDGRDELTHEAESKFRHKLATMCRANGFVGIAAQPVVYVVVVIHSTILCVRVDVCLDVDTHNPPIGTAKREVSAHRGALPPFICAGIPSLEPPPRPAQAGPAVQRDDEQPIWGDQGGSASDCPVHVAGVVQNAPRSDDVMLPRRLGLHVEYALASKPCLGIGRESGEGRSRCFDRILVEVHARHLARSEP